MNNKQELIEIYDIIYNIYHYHNKNLNKKQMQGLDEAVEKFEKILKEMED